MTWDINNKKNMLIKERDVLRRNFKSGGGDRSIIRPRIKEIDLWLNKLSKLQEENGKWMA